VKGKRERKLAKGEVALRDLDLWLRMLADDEAASDAPEAGLAAADASDDADGDGPAGP
jgi:hypothetical protein